MSARPPRGTSLVSALAVAILLATGCGDDGSSDDDAAAEQPPAPDAEAPEPTETTETPTSTTGPEPATEPSETAELTASFKGVTPESIRIGVHYVDLETIRDLVDLDHGSYEDAFRAVIDDLNGRGGINGRLIEPIFAGVSPIDQAGAEFACLTLTEDTEVFAVIGAFFEDQPLCYVENNETAVVGGTITDERLERATAPWYTPFISDERAVTDVLDALVEAGEFEGATLAVLTGSGDEALIDEVAEPILAASGIEITDRLVLDTSVPEPLVIEPLVGAIAERFRSADIDTVLVLGDAITTFLNGLETTGYRPRILGTTIGSARAYIRDTSADNDLSVLEGAVIGGAGEQRIWWENPAVQDCIDLIETAQPGLEIIDPGRREPNEPENIVSIFNACRTVFLFEAIATAAGPDLTYDTFREAAEGLGEIDLPGTGAASFGPDKPDGDDSTYLYVWDTEAQDVISDGIPL